MTYRNILQAKRTDLPVRFIYLFLFCVCFSPFVAAQEDLQQIEGELEEILVRDQGVRKKLMTIGTASEEGADLLQQMRADDKRHQEYVSALLDSSGWPEHLSYEAHMAIFLVIDHAPLGFQQTYVGLVREMEEKEILHPSLTVGLYDRIQMLTGEMQEYGTQIFRHFPTGQLYLWPVRGVEGLDARRDAAELVPMEEYLEAVGDVIWDKKMTVKQANRLRKER